MKTTIVIPVFNEVESLPKLLELLGEITSEETKFLLVDNGSSDPTVREMLMEKSDKWQSVRTETNLGFGGGILFGVESSKTEYVGWMPGNLKIDPREVVQILDSNLIAEVDFLKARRVSRGLIPRIKTFLAGILQSLLLRTRLFDTGGTPTVCKRSFFSNLKNIPTDYVFESFIYFQARKKGLQIKRPEIHYGERSFGQSHWQRGIRSEILLLMRILKSSRSWEF